MTVLTVVIVQIATTTVHLVQEEVLNRAVYLLEIVMTAKTLDIVVLVKTLMIIRETTDKIAYPKGWILHSKY